MLPTPVGASSVTPGGGPVGAGLRVRKLIGLGALCLIILAVGWVLWISPPERGPGYPQEWDPRVEALVHFVAGQRALEWEHPVYIDFVDPEEFEKSMTTDDDLSDEERAAVDDATASLRAMGLVEGDVDLLSRQNDLEAGGVAAYYSFETKRITVKGTELTVATKATLVHELTHAIQDQNFDLSRIGTFETDAQNDNLRMVVEGDASQIEQDYVEQLSEPDRNAYAEETTSQGDEVMDRISEVPDIMVALFAAPYRIGPAFVEAIRERYGNSGVDALIRTPPPTEAQVLDLQQYLDGREPVDVETRPLGDGEEKINDVDLGAMGWFLVLAERIDPLTALDVVDGWSGDSMVTYRADDRVCVALRYRGLDTDATASAAVALDEWASTMPVGMAKISRLGDFVELLSCDPGSDVMLDLEGRSMDAIEYPTLRLQLQTALFAEFHAAAQPIDDDLVFCATDSFLHTLTFEEMTEATSVDPTDMQQRMTTAIETCRR